MGDSLGWRRMLTTIALAAVVIALGVTATAYGLIRHARGPSPAYRRPSGIPASITDSQAGLMELSPVPDRSAPGFTLTDQDGRTLPVSAEFVDAYRDLGRLAGQVVFAAVNVNQYHHAIADVAAYSRARQLTSIPSWHFLTGPVPRLRAVWKAYNVAVQAPGPDADIVHSSLVYFIDRAGRERYLASPQADHTASGSSYLPARRLAAWGRGIAQVARALAGGQGQPA
jgi:hypothetical protein